ncbi:MAG: hypothetical protein LAT65_21095 [Saccharospirillum sp.]|nr:hypothetical protein [Saccharospirillum sp.]
MKLQDFKAFDPFNRMRERMGTEHFGFFELFDPERHLTGEERSLLARKGVSVPQAMLGRLLDFTLVYKNSRVALIDDHHFHVANCEHLISKATVRLGTASRAFGPSLTVCPGCLQLLSYKGYDEQKARKEGYNRSVLERFTLDAFWRSFPPYPLKLGRELVKPLEFPRPASSAEPELAGVVATREA